MDAELKPNFTLLLLVLSTAVYSQSNKLTRILFVPYYGEEQLIQEKYYPWQGYDSIMVENLKFYVSGFRLCDDMGHCTEASAPLLITPFEVQQYSLKTSGKVTENQNRLSFSIGLDSTTNCSGAHSGDLDPLKGMYWTWQSGYIHFKVEGRCSASGSKDKTFAYHIGGFREPFPTERKTELRLGPNETIMIKVDLKKFLEHLHIKDQHHLMSPGKPAAELSAYLPSLFSIERPHEK